MSNPVSKIALPAGALTTPLALLPSVALSQGYGGMSDRWENGMGFWGHMLFGGLTMLLFWGALIVLIVIAIRWLNSPASTATSHGPHASAGRSPLDILKERFAKGEIDKADYEERRQALKD